MTDIPIIRALAATPGAGAHMARNPGAPAPLLDVFARTADTETRKAVAAHANTAAETLRLLASDPSPAVRASTARNATTPPDALTGLCFDEGKQVRVAALSNLSTPPMVVSGLCNDKSVGYYASAWRGWATAEPEQLPTHPTSAGRLARAANIHTPAEELARLSRSKDLRTAAAVAANPSTGHKVLSRMAKHDERLVRSKVAANPSTPPKVLVELLNDDGGVVHMSIVDNPAATGEMLDAFAADRYGPKGADDGAGLYAAASPLLTRNTATTMVERGQIGALRWPGWTAQDLDAYAEHNGYRGVVADHPATSPATLRRLAEVRENVWCQVNVARNPNTPRDLLETMASDKFSVSVNHSVLTNPALADDLASAAGVTPSDLSETMAL